MEGRWRGVNDVDSIGASMATREVGGWWCVREKVVVKENVELDRNCASSTFM